MIKQILLVAGMTTGTACISFAESMSAPPEETIAQASSCFDAMRTLSKDITVLSYTPLESAVTEAVIDRGWLTPKQMAEVQEAGYKRVKIGMNSCQVVWTMRSLPDDIDT